MCCSSGSITSQAALSMITLDTSRPALDECNTLQNNQGATTTPSSTRMVNLWQQLDLPNVIATTTTNKRKGCMLCNSGTHRQPSIPRAVEACTHHQSLIGKHSRRSRYEQPIVSRQSRDCYNEQHERHPYCKSVTKSTRRCSHGDKKPTAFS